LRSSLNILGNTATRDCIVSDNSARQERLVCPFSVVRLGYGWAEQLFSAFQLPSDRAKRIAPAYCYWSPITTATMNARAAPLESAENADEDGKLRLFTP